MREVATNLNVGHLMLLLQFGNMSKDLTPLQHEAVRRTGDAETERTCSPDWEDRWWPQPMDAAQRAEIPAFMP